MDYYNNPFLPQTPVGFNPAPRQTITRVNAINTAAINANTTAQVQKILDALTANRMAEMQNEINALQLQAATSNLLRFPNSWTYAGGNFPPTTTTTP